MVSVEDGKTIVSFEFMSKDSRVIVRMDLDMYLWCVSESKDMEGLRWRVLELGERKKMPKKVKVKEVGL